MELYFQQILEDNEARKTLDRSITADTEEMGLLRDNLRTLSNELYLQLNCLTLIELSQEKFAKMVEPQKKFLLDVHKQFSQTTSQNGQKRELAIVPEPTRFFVPFFE